jgi:hypothetical protein
MKAIIKREVNPHGSFFNVYSVDSDGVEKMERSVSYQQDADDSSQMNEKNRLDKALDVAKSIETVPCYKEIVYETGKGIIK